MEDTISKYTYAKALVTVIGQVLVDGDCYMKIGKDICKYRNWETRARALSDDEVKHLTDWYDSVHIDTALIYSVHIPMLGRLLSWMEDSCHGSYVDRCLHAFKFDTKSDWYVVMWSDSHLTTAGTKNLPIFDILRLCAATIHPSEDKELLSSLLYSAAGASQRTIMFEEPECTITVKDGKFTASSSNFLYDLEDDTDMCQIYFMLACIGTAECYEIISRRHYYLELGQDLGDYLSGHSFHDMTEIGMMVSELLRKAEVESDNLLCILEEDLK